MVSEGTLSIPIPTPQDLQMTLMPEAAPLTPDIDTNPSSPTSSLDDCDPDDPPVIIPLPWLPQLREVSRASTPNTYDRLLVLLYGYLFWELLYNVYPTLRIWDIS